MWSDETKIKLFGINSTCRDWRGKKAEYEHHPHREAWRWKHSALGLFLCQGYRTTQPLLCLKSASVLLKMPSYAIMTRHFDAFVSHGSYPAAIIFPTIWIFAHNTEYSTQIRLVHAYCLQS